MAFGFGNAPATFQGIMNTSLARSTRKIVHGTYMDDATIGGPDPKTCWEDTVEAMTCVLR